jgi:stage II sporulation protein M
MKKDFDYLYSSRKYILAVTGLFIVSIIFGFLESAANPTASEGLLDAFEKLAERIRVIEPPLLQTMVLFLIIFLNNAIKSLAVIVLGLGFCILPLFFVAYNGQALGMVVDLFSREKGVLFVLAALLPHGIIEIPVILVSAGIGVRLGYLTYLSLRGGGANFDQGLVHVVGFYHKKFKMDMMPELKQGVDFYMRRLLPLLFLAAIVESNVTPLIVSLLYK